MNRCSFELFSQFTPFRSGDYKQVAASRWIEPTKNTNWTRQICESFVSKMRKAVKMCAAISITATVQIPFKLNGGTPQNRWNWPKKVEAVDRHGVVFIESERLESCILKWGRRAYITGKTHNKLKSILILKSVHVYFT